MTVEQAREVLRAAGWRPGVSLVGHPCRADCKAALAVLRRAGVDPRQIEEHAVPAPAPQRWIRHVGCALVLVALGGFAFVALAVAP